MDYIEIDNLRLRATIGFSAHELDAPQDIVIGLRIGVDDRLAAETDCPGDAFNYRSVTKAIISRVERSRFKLVEKLAEEIARVATIEFGAPYVEVNLHKPGALRRADSVGISIARRPADFGRNAVFVSLGSNIEPEKNMIAALALLRQWTTVLRHSPVYRTAPQGFAAQAHFFNMAVQAHTSRSPEQFKSQVIDRIETALGRVRDPRNKNAPRTIDLDISLWNDGILEYGERPWKIPDPDIRRFAHVARPLADIAPDYRHPEAGVALRDIAAALDAAGIETVDLDLAPDAI